MKLSKFTKQIIAVVMAFALILVSNCFMIGTANAAQLTWDQLTDGLGSATVTNTSTDSAYGASFVGFVTDESWGPDSKWQGQAIKQGIPVESGKDYKVSVDFTASAQKKVLIQTLCGSNDYTERTYTINSTKQHIDFNFHATASTVKVVVAFGSMSDAGTYDIYIEDMTVEEETGPVPSVLEWTEFTDGLGQATVANTSTETKFGATFTGFQTNTSWGGDSIWQGQAKKTNYPVENGKNYTISLDASSTPGKKFRVQVLCNGVYTQDTFDVSSNTHIDLPFAATASTIQFIIAFGANDASEIGTYDIEISNLSIDKAEEPSTEEPTTAENTCAQAAWTFVDDPGTSGWQYYVANANSTYSGGTAINDPLVIDYGTYVEAADTCQARSPVTAVVGGTSCEGSISIDNSSPYTMQNVKASVYAVDTSTTPYTYTWYQASEEGTQSAPAGGSATFTFDYTAPDVGYIVYVIDTSYSPTAALTFSATHSGEEPTTPTPTTTAHTDPCAQAAWTFTDDPGTSGWQYYVANADSTYSGGTDIDTPLVINYGTYVEAADTCQARSPVTAVVGGTSCEGSISINNSSIYTMQNIQASVYAVDTSTSPYTYTWYQASEEGAQSAPAGGSATFTFDYTAPDVGYIVYVIDTSYSPTAALTFSATHSGEEPTTPTPTTTAHTDPCAQAAWTFTDDPGTSGWQYYVANADSTYSGGTDIDTPLVINYGTYVEAADTCQARSPVTAVIGGTPCTGSISVDNPSIYTMQNVQASVYAVDTSTTPYTYTWYHASEEGAQSAPAGGSATFTFDYTAPDVGYIVYVIDTSYSPTTTLTFSATHDGAYDVSEYKSGATYTYPVKAGKVFAGWFTDNTYTTPYTATTGNAYAKFVDAKSLSVKFQVANDDSAIRFVSTVDGMDYDQVGFKFTGIYGNSAITEKTKTTNSLYSKITADGESILPTVFSDDSAYFFTYTVRGMTDAGTNSTWNVTPFFVTLDGTTVNGTTGTYPVS